MYIIIKNINENIQDNIIHMKKIINYDTITHMDIIDVWGDSMTLYMSFDLFKIIQNVIDVTLPPKYTPDNFVRAIDVRNLPTLQVISRNMDGNDDIINHDIFTRENIDDDMTIYSLEYYQSISFYYLLINLNATLCMNMKIKLQTTN